MPDFSRRSTMLEWLDTATPTREERARYLKSLASFNRAMFGQRPVLSWLKAATRDVPAGTPLTLLDVGCGYGDLLRTIRHWAARRGLPLRLMGMDIEADTVAIAREATAAAEGVDYVVADVFNLKPTVKIDFIVSSLLAHHLDDGRLTAFVRWMEMTARRGWLIADLQRHPVPYHVIGLAGRLMRVHPMVIKDGRISVTRALARAEWRPALAAAGLDPDAARQRWFLYRCLVSRLRL